jgi:aerobic carbon-monoxide dehydrogenase large subunit
MTAVLRKEDHRLLTGVACFVDDLHRPRMLHATVLRSTQGHARIAALDVAAARAHPGVVDVLTAGDLPPATPRIPMRMFRRDGMERFLQPPLAGGVVRYSGEPVAVVVADSRYAAEDGAELVDVDYEPLDAVVDAEAALAAGAPVLHERAGTNLAAEFTIGDGDTDAAFAGADVVVEARIASQRHAAVPLETRGLVAEEDRTTGRLTVWGAAKIVHVNRGILGRMLGRPEEGIRLVELDVGGGFGARGEFYPEDFLIPWCAIRLGRPVTWTEDREEHLRATNHSREQLHDIALALRADGTFVALRDRVLFDTGAYVRTHGTVVGGMTAGLLPGPYRFDAYRCTVAQVVTNKTPAGTYRAPGRFEAGLARERVIDMAARRLGQDPVELRRRNLVPASAMPYANGASTDGHPVVYDSGDYALLVDKALAGLDWKGLRAWRGAPAPAGRRRGLGCALFVEKSGIGGWEYARVTLRGDGTAIVHTGTASMGQGVETVLAQICAERLGCEYADVDVRHGDTDVVPRGMGAFGSRATSLGGGAVVLAAGALRERVLGLAADALEASAADLEIAGAAVRVRGAPDASVPIAELSDGADLSEEADFHCEAMSFPYGFHVAAVEVDPETGSVAIHRYGVAYDVGRAINDRLVHGQIVGGVAQGVGGALLEELAYDEDGQLLSGSFMDYLLPTSLEAPPVDVLVTEDAPTPLNPLGAKGAGEGGTSAAGGALANAVSDALDRDANRLPLSPARVRELAAS